MIVIIAGSREGVTYADVVEAIELSGFHITEVASGKCRGVDAFGERWATEHSVPVKPFPANWRRFGKSAGPIRNQVMADDAEALVAVRIRIGKSDGTDDMIAKAKAGGLFVFVHYV